jgi:hypothetical protein
MGFLDKIKAKLTRQPCAPAKGLVVVIVSRTDTGQLIAGATATIAGPSPGSGPTDDLGAHIFEDRTPGNYTATVTLPPSMAAFRITDRAPGGSVAALGTLVLPWKAAPVGNLYLEVYDDTGKPVTEASQLAASGAGALGQAVKTGSHTFTDVPCGTYQVSATLPAGLFERARVSADDVEVTPGATARRRLLVKRLVNVVTPKIEMEYRVVLLDRKLSSHQEPAETKIVTDDATRIEISAAQTTGAPPYLGDATFEATPAHVDVFTDKACTKKLVEGKILNAQLAGGAPVALWLKAKTKGKFTAKLTLGPSNHGQVQVKGPATEAMGVVELEATLHRFDKGELDALEVDAADDPLATYHTKLKDKALPAQKALTDAQKVQEGRLLHRQDGQHHGRARLIVKQLVADQWPGDTDDYDIVLANEGGALALFDKEVEGTEQALPFKLKVKDLKAKDHEYWVEGKAESAKLRDAVFDLGLDRDQGGLAKEAKKNGDWSRFTVIRIDKLELVVTVPAGQPKIWDAGKKRYYINSEAGAAGRTLGDKAGQREVKVVATLSKEIEGVPLHFMLAPHPENAAPTGLPATWKAETLKPDLRRLDRRDRKALMHFSQASDAKGKAEIKTLVLSALGGDRFTPAAYIEQDPHLAKYVQDHAELGKRVPKLADDTLQVWKYFDYRIAYMKRHDGTSYANRFAEATLSSKFDIDFIEMARKGEVVEAPHSYYVPYETARDWVTAQLGADEKRVIKLAFVDAIGHVATSDKEMSAVGISGLKFGWKVAASEMMDLSAQDKWLKSAQAGAVGALSDIPLSSVTLVDDGVDYKLSVDLSGIAAVQKMAVKDIAVKLVLLKHEGPSGLSWGPATLVNMRWRESQYPGKEDVATQRTAFHEIGHYLGLVAKTLPDTGATASTLWYDSPGTGNHCKFGTEDCTMWYQFKMKMVFCPTCKLAMRARDHARQVSGSAAF